MELEHLGNIKNLFSYFNIFNIAAIQSPTLTLIPSKESDTGIKLIKTSSYIPLITKTFPTIEPVNVSCNFGLSY